MPASGQARRGRNLRTPPGPKGSNGKEVLLGAAGILSGLFVALLYSLWHNCNMPRWIWFIIALGLGLAAGLYFGWVLNPVSYVDTTPDSLRADYRADYVLMVAEAFSTSRDPSTAARELAILGSQPPAATVSQALVYAHSVNFSPEDIELIQQLAFAMQTWQQPTPGSGLP